MQAKMNKRCPCVYSSTALMFGKGSIQATMYGLALRETRMSGNWAGTSDYSLSDTICLPISLSRNINARTHELK